MGNLEKNYQARFLDTLDMYAQTIATNQPIDTGSKQNHVMDISHLTRKKRNPLRFFLSLLRFARPATSVAKSVGNVGRAARVISKASKYSKFLKAIKWTSIGLSVASIPFDIAQAFGVFDFRYTELSNELIRMNENRGKDLQVMGNITLVTLQLNNMIMNLQDDLGSIISEAQTLSEISLFGSVIFNSYITTLQTSMSLLLTGRLPQTLLSLDNQRNWIEKKIPSPLLSSIGSSGLYLLTSKRN